VGDSDSRQVVDFDNVPEVYWYALRDFERAIFDLEEQRKRIRFIQEFGFDYLLTRGIVISGIGLNKKQSGRAVFDPVQHQSVIDAFVEKCRAYGVPEEMIRIYFEPSIRAIMQGAVEFQQALIDDDALARRTESWIQEMAAGLKAAQERISQHLSSIEGEGLEGSLKDKGKVSNLVNRGENSHKRS